MRIVSSINFLEDSDLLQLQYQLLIKYMLLDSSLQVIDLDICSYFLANTPEGVITVLGSDGEKISNITIPYAPEITGLGFSKYKN
jgi:hypothetical protein